MSILLFAIPIVGIILVFLKDTISARVYELRERSTKGDLNPALGAVVTLLWMAWKAVSIVFYIFLFVFPLLALFVYFGPKIQVARKQGFTLQYLLIYDQRDDAIALLSTPVDKSLPSDSPEMVQADADKLRAVFAEEKDWKIAVSWGHQIAHTEYFYDISFDRRLSDEQAAHLAWRALLRVPGAKESDLLNLEATIEQAVPDSGTRQQLLAWGRSRLDLLEQLRPKPYAIVTLPKLDWFAWWLVYSDYCPTEAVFEARQDHLTECFGKRRFGRSVWQALLDWGEELQPSQPFNKDLPPGERSSIVAVLDHISGFSAVGKTIEELRDEYQIGFGKDYGLLALLMHIFYPNDDMIYLMFGNGWSDKHSFLTAISEVLGGGLLASHLFALNLVFWALLVQRCMRRLTIHYVGKVLLLEGTPSFEQFRTTIFNPWLQLLSLVVVIPLTWLFACLFMDDLFVVYYHSGFNLLLAVLYTALIGGALCEAFENILAVLLLRFGLDPERTFIDNLVAAGLGSAILWFFQNSWFSILSGIMLGLFLSLVVKILSRRRPPSQREGRRRPTERKTR